MKFTATSSSLGAKLIALGKVINKMNALPILGDIVFDVKGGELSLTASDSEMWMQTGMELTESDGEMSFAIGAHDIIEAVKGLAEQPLTFDLDMEKHTVRIIHSTGQFSLPVEDSAEFPKPAEIKGDVHKQVDKALLNECITRAQSGCADNELRPVMNGVYFDFKGEYLAIVSTDGHKLYRNKLTEYKSETVGSFIMPKKVVAVLRGTFSKEAGEVSVHFDERNARIDYDTTILTFRLIEGRYPNYDSVIPQSCACEARVDRACLLAALKRVQNFSNAASYLVCFTFDGEKLQLDAEDYDFSKTATETVAMEYNGELMSIGFKSTTFVEILSSLASKEVLIQLTDPSRAALIVPAEQKEGVDVVVLSMPMLLNDKK